MTESDSFRDSLRKELDDSSEAVRRRAQEEAAAQLSEQTAERQAQQERSQLEARQRELQPPLCKLLAADFRDFAVLMQERAISPPYRMNTAKIIPNQPKSRKWYQTASHPISPQVLPPSINVWLLRQERKTTVRRNPSSNVEDSPTYKTYFEKHEYRGLLMGENSNPWKFIHSGTGDGHSGSHPPEHLAHDWRTFPTTKLDLSDIRRRPKSDQVIGFAGEATIDDIVPHSLIALDVGDIDNQPLVQDYRNSLIEIAKTAIEGTS